MEVNGTQYYTLKTRTNLTNNSSSISEIYCIVLENFAVNIAISYTNDQEKKELLEMIETMDFKLVL